MSSWTEPLRSWLKPARRTGRARPGARLGVEALEVRDTPTILVTGTPPVWESVGPDGIADAGNVILGSPAQNVQVGAINQVAVDPFNPTRVAVASDNGGVWVATNFPSATPNWATTTDNLPSLAISSVAYSPVIPNLLFAGTGSYTSGGLGQGLFFSAGVNSTGIGGAAVGIYRSADGGLTWTQVGQNTFTGIRIRDIIPTTLNGGNTVFAITHDGGPGATGVYRSDNQGATWTRLSGANGLPSLGVTSMIADPANPNKFYAAPVGPPIAGESGPGVYMLDVTGGNQTWVNVSNNLPSAAQTGSRILLASTPTLTSSGVNPIYAAVVGPTGIPQGIYRAVPFASGFPPVQTYIWTKIGPGGLPPDVSAGQQGDVHFALVADPTSDHIVYVAGDRKQVGPFAGTVARGDAIANTWELVTAPDPPGTPATPGTVTPTTPSPAPTTAPHPDFRGLSFAGTNTLIAVTDGGIYQATNPRGGAAAPVWSSLNGKLVISELYQADVDNRGTASTADDVYMASAQDNGSSEAQFGQSWTEVFGGDGVLVRADDANGFRYYSAQFLFLVRRNPNQSLTFTAGAINGGGSLNGNAPFLPVLTLNQADTSQMLVGGPFQDLYLSLDQGNTYRSIGGVAGSPVANLTSTVSAIAFGTTQIRNAAYVATADGNLAQTFDVTIPGGGFTLTDFQAVAGGNQALNLVMDPNNPLVAYAVTKDGVYRTINGTNWVNITGTLASSLSPGGLVTTASITLFTNNTVNPADDVLLVGGYGGVYAARVGQVPSGGAAPWLKFGDNFPNVLVTDLRYDALADTVVAGTYGRGVFRMTSASTALIGGPVITVTGTAAANTIAVYVDPADPTRFVVSDGVTTQSFSLTSFRNVVLRGLGGADTIIVGSPAAGTPGTTFPLSLNITVDAGNDAGDTLVIQNAAAVTAAQATLTPTNIGGGAADTLFKNGGSVNYTGLNKGTVQVRLGSSAGDLLVFDDTVTVAAADYTVSATRVTRSAGGTYDYSGADALMMVTGSGANTVNVASLATPLYIDTGAGADALQLAGTAAGEAITAQVTTAAGGGNVVGYTRPVSYAGVETVGFAGNGGSDSFAVQDLSDTAYGTPTTPGAGLVVAPGGADSATVRVGTGVQFVVTGIASLTVDGDLDNSGDRDTLLVLGTSAPGLQSAFGEAVVGDGRDVITVTDSAVTLATTRGTRLLGVSFNTAAVNTLYVAAGNETGVGDQITVTPSTLVNIVIDGQGPTAAPGDRVDILGGGPFLVVPVTDPAFGPPQNQVNAADGSTVGLIGIERTSMTQAGVSSGMVAVATDAGPETVVRVFDRLTGALRYQVTPFPGFFGGATVASGDLTGDGIADLIVGAGVGGAPRVAIFNGVDGAKIADFFGYEDTFRGGVNVSAADFDGDGYTDIVLGTGMGGGPRVRVLSGRDYSPIRDVFAYDARFRGGVNVAAGDVNGDGTPDLVTSTGSGGGPQVVVFSGKDLRQIASFFVFDPSSRAGFYAAVGDVNGDGYADVIVGSGAGEAAQVRVFSGLNRTLLTQFYVSDPLVPGLVVSSMPFDTSVRVAAADLNGDGVDDIITGKGPGSTPTLRAYQVGAVNPATNSLEAVLQEIRHQDVFEGDLPFGIFVGGGN